MLEAIDDMVYGRVLAGLALAVLAFELIVLLMAAARRRRGGPPLPMKLHAMAGAATLLVPIAVAISVYAARALMLGIYRGGGTDPSERGAALSEG